VTGRAAVVRAVLSTARHDDIVVTGWSACDLAMRATWEPDRPAACCDYLVAEVADVADVAGDGASRCDIADVIIWRSCPVPDVARAQLSGVLRRYRGCAVAAVGAGSVACLIADRYGSTRSVAVGGRDCPPGLCALACCSFAYGWLCAGWPLAALNPELRIAASRGWAGSDGLAQGVVVSCSLTVAGPVPVS
jgi:hypothetical protein